MKKQRKASKKSSRPKVRGRDQRISLLHAQRRIALAWIIPSIVAVLLAGIQITAGKYTGADSVEHKDVVLQWLIPSIVPTSALILGVLASLETNNRSSEMARRKTVTVFFYRLTLGLALLHLSLVLALLWYAGGIPDAGIAAKTLTGSSSWTATLQGLVDLAIGVFFVTSKDHDDEKPAPAATAPADDGSG